MAPALSRPIRVNLYGALGGANTVTVGSVMNWTGNMSGSENHHPAGSHAEYCRFDTVGFNLTISRTVDAAR